jgi:TolB-like protein
MGRNIAAILMAFCVAAAASAQTEKMRIVTFDLTPKTPEVAADSAMLSELLRNEFIKTGRFEVVSREQTARILAETDFQNTGITSAEDAIQIGKLLNVRRAIVGSVGTLGGTVFVTVQLFDMQSGRFITAESMEAPSMKEIVTRMDSTVDLLADAAYQAEGIPPAGPPASQGKAAAAPKPAPTPIAPGGAGKRPTTLNWIGYGSTIVGLGGLAAGYFVFDKNAAAAYNLALSSKAAYDAATSNFTALWNDYQTHLTAANTNAKLRLVSYIAGGALAAGGIVLAILPPPGPAKTAARLNAGIALFPNGLLVTLSY